MGDQRDGERVFFSIDYRQADSIDRTATFTRDLRCKFYGQLESKVCPGWIFATINEDPKLVHMACDVMATEAIANGQ